MTALAGRTILITGSTAGLGLEVARRLVSAGATVLVHGRDPGRLERALVAVGGGRRDGRVHGLLADLASLDATRRLARDVAVEFGRPDVLVNNAGVASISGPRRESAEGYELTFAVNYLAGFLLTLELLPALRAAASARVVNIASIGQAPIDLDDLMLERAYDGNRAYARSKLAQVMFTFELAERLVAAGEPGVTVNALHPATLMDTAMVRGTLGRPRSTVAEGAEATLRLIAAPELERVSGRYFDGVDESAADPQAYDRDARRRLWALSEELTGTRFG
ncbi:MAG TPA: SDR family NAD(P)-dependent oxidoreductase [Solirubrobacterales bacterium]|nr:SDR family NAD(P)-dependent oxidoreductase [Solirubrobacterales bacterium]